MTNRIRSGATGLLLAPLLVLAACTTPPPSGTGSVPSSPAQPALATYRCDEGRVIRLENRGSIVRVHDIATDDEAGAAAAPIELAAAPPGQRSRYGLDGYALVLEDREALWMKAGKAPLTCTR